jgi:radical SAM protein with 4Fe4S-binding SPASM domain
MSDLDMGILNKLNYFLYRYEYINGQKLKLTRPVDVSLELAGVCNQKCVYCYWADAKNIPFKPGMMKLETATKILDQAADLGVYSLKFNWRGESTMNPHFLAVTTYAKSLSDSQTFIDRVTNSNFKFDSNRDDIFEGLCNQTKVKVSFDSFRKEIFEAQRVGGIFEKALLNVDIFYNHPLRKDTELVLQAVRTKQNADEDIEGYVKKRWPGATVSIREVVEGRVNKDISKIVNKDRGQDRIPCKQAFVRIIFTHDGKASPCCPSISDKLFIGDIEKQSLFEIFNSHEAMQLRDDLKSGKAFENDPCKTCSSFESYKGYKAPWRS